LLKSHSCGELRKNNVGAEVTLAGWVDRRRDHGGLIFIDLRDREGVTQVVFDPETSADCHKTADKMRSEYVIQVSGQVCQRPKGTENPKLPTGDIEVIAHRARILNKSKTPPFYINEEVEVDEAVSPPNGVGQKVLEAQLMRVGGWEVKRALKAGYSLLKTIVLSYNKDDEEKNIQNHCISSIFGVGVLCNTLWLY
jgi:aspartyl/asparaginyl-tRNA synthetase